MLENITNKVVTNLSDNISSMSSFALKEPSGQNSSDYLYAKEERTLSDTEDKGIESKERSDVLAAGHRVKFHPYSGQAWHPNFDTVV